ncbi:transposase [Riemerella anatipestifer]|nr:transposase [Riemerella anatipestifer]
MHKRSVIEIVNNELKNICQSEHSRHCSGTNFITNLIAGIVTYYFFP